ncbi:hypothetical protein [Neorhizobium galegae]|uniref:hypothetical protein n=1 Tax=Neorhizobium galegae TaxID=399 RepID=UPI0012D5B9B8|nr:hypothetical protein [Neorhizobium galegae]KAB1121646.1 hypothetical protein F4V90_23735 [Neorhizobium galegae]MCQ1574886.1 hypothetical protein [Neorhizobium galegae]MCQ1807885.1 hypothetical protein [Neorhizobium galegae]MCQ1837707.1 hypothetical protein [Neorhizobium galegae]
MADLSDVASKRLSFVPAASLFGGATTEDQIAGFAVVSTRRVRDPKSLSRGSSGLPLKATMRANHGPCGAPAITQDCHSNQRREMDGIDSTSC